MTTQITNEQLVARYIELREAISQLKAAYDAKNDALKDAQDAIATELDTRMKANGLTSMKTGAGGVSRVTKRSIVMRDSGEFMRFIRTHNLPELLQKRASTKEIEEYVSNGNALPDGLGYDDTITISVRK